MTLTLHTLPISIYNPFAAAWRALCAAVTQQSQSPANPMPTVEILGKGATLTLRRPAGYRIECLEGCVWVTLDDDTRDIFISAGQSYWPDRNAQALVHALEDSRVTIVHGAQSGLCQG